MKKVYLITDTDCYKIGKTTKSVYQRIKKLQTGNPRKIKLVHIFLTENYHLVETMLKQMFKPKCRNGEWFDLEKDVVQNFNKICKDLDDIINTEYL